MFGGEIIKKTIFLLHTFNLRPVTSSVLKGLKCIAIYIILILAIYSYIINGLS